MNLNLPEILFSNNRKSSAYESAFGSKNKFSISKGDRIAQLIIEKCHDIQVSLIMVFQVTLLDDSRLLERSYIFLFRRPLLPDSTETQSQEQHTIHPRLILVRIKCSMGSKDG